VASSSAFLSNEPGIGLSFTGGWVEEKGFKKVAALVILTG
jgi:hypothetical protein